MMYKYSIIIIAAFITCIDCSSSRQYSIPDIIIGDVSVLPMTDGDEILHHRFVEITKGRITDISDKRSNLTSKFIKGDGQYLIPGLTEMHAHIPTPKDGDDLIVRETLFLYLSQGVTTIRGMLGSPYHLQLKKQISSGNILSPRVYTSSPSMNGNSITSPEEARTKVAEYAKAGYDFLKIHPGIKIENWNALEEAAKEYNIPYAGHVPYEVGIERAISARYATIDHLDGFVEGLLPANSYQDSERGFFGFGLIEGVERSRIKELVRRIKENNVAVVPTQTLFSRWFSPVLAETMLLDDEMQYMPAQTRFAWRQSKSRLISDSSYTEVKWQEFTSIREEILQELYRQKALILLGSDAPQVMNVPGFSLHHEMKDMVDAGMLISDILKSGTSKPAEFFNQKGDFGCVAVGSSADLILLSANPLKDIGNVKLIEKVIVRGVILEKTDIETQLKLIALRNK